MRIIHLSSGSDKAGNYSRAGHGKLWWRNQSWKSSAAASEDYAAVLTEMKLQFPADFTTVWSHGDLSDWSYYGGNRGTWKNRQNPNALAQDSYTTTPARWWLDMHNTLSESRMGITKYSHLPFIGTAVTGDSHPVLPSNPVCVQFATKTWQVHSTKNQCTRASLRHENTHD